MVKATDKYFIFIALLLSVSIFYFQYYPVSAATNSEVLGSLSYWEAGTTSSFIGRWNSINIGVQYNNVSGLSESQWSISSYMNHGYSQWNSALSVYLYTTTSASSISYYFGDHYQVYVLGISGLVVDYNNSGYTTPYAYNEGIWSYGSSSKTGKAIYSAVGAVYYIAGKTSSQYKNTTTHELGHALGWYGHTTSSTSIMYNSSSSITLLSTIDKRHLQQVY